MFDQLLFLLNKTVYSHYKDAAAMRVLDKPARKSLERCARSVAALDAKTDAKAAKKRQQASAEVSTLARSIGERAAYFAPVGKERYESVMSQRHVQLLGQSVDLNYLITQRINASLRQDAECAVVRFEAGDLTGVVELKMTLDVVRETHTMLDRAFSVNTSQSTQHGLDDFDVILAEVDESVGATTLRGRIAMHVVAEMVMDLFPNWLYDGALRRFIKPAATSFRQQARASRKRDRKRSTVTPDKDYLFGKRYTRAFESQCRLHRSFVGRPHFEAIVELLHASGDLPMLISELLTNLSHLVSEQIGPYVATLKAGIRPIKLPPYMLRAGGCYMAVQLHLADILNYEDLKSQVFQHFRELGNTLALFNVLGDAVAQWDALTFVQAASFLGVTPASCTMPTEPLTAVPKEPASADTGPSVPPLVRHIQTFVDGAGPALHARHAPRANAMGSLALFAAQASAVYGAADNTASATATREPLLRVALQTLHQALEDAEADLAAAVADGHFADGYEGPLWVDAVDPVNGVLDVEGTTAFHRLWSALQFMFCEPVKPEDSSNDVGAGGEEEKGSTSRAKPLTDQEEFGDGMAWGGCAIIHLLQQRESFRLLDFSYHVLSVSEWEGLHDTSAVKEVDGDTKASLAVFLQNARRCRARNQRLFAMFEAHLAFRDDELIVFRLPEDDSPEAMGTVKVQHAIPIKRASHMRGTGSSGSVSGPVAEPELFFGGGAAPAITQHMLAYERKAEELSVVKSSPMASTIDALAEGWEAVIDPDSGDVYYSNMKTGETTWDRPRGASMGGASDARSSDLQRRDSSDDHDEDFDGGSFSGVQNRVAT